MLGKTLLLAVLAAAQGASAAGEYLGFNYGAKKTSGADKLYADFKEEFELAKALPGASGKFTSARLYTMMQAGQPTPIEAIQAAIDTKTSLLLGIWCSAGSEIVDNEITALTAAIEKYGTDFTDLVVGLSVGSEDLYRNSVMGIQNESGIGAQPSQIVDYINRVKKALSGTALKSVPIGHVDTWTVWVNGTNNPVIEALDWIGFDAYPYFQSTMANSIDDAASLFWDAYIQTQQATGKEVWITETGWPVQGKDMNLAEAGVTNAQQYWNEIGCAIFGNYKTWWYMLRDADPTPPETEFGVVGSDLKPYYDLSCKTAKPVSSPVAGATTTAKTTATAAAKTTGSTFVVETTGSSYAPSSTGTGSAQTTDSPSSASLVLPAAMGLVAIQAVVAAIFLL